MQLAEDNLVISKLKLDTAYVESCLLCSLFQAGQGEIPKSQIYFGEILSVSGNTLN
jgi:hypothetical protein